MIITMTRSKAYQEPGSRQPLPYPNRSQGERKPPNFIPRTSEFKRKANPLANDSLAVANTDSWSTFVNNGELLLYLNATDRGREMRLEVALDSGWHTLDADSAEGSFNMSLDGRVLVTTYDWNGNITRVELGTALQYADGIVVRGVLSFSRVKADLQPLVESQMFLSLQRSQNPLLVMWRKFAKERDPLASAMLLGFSSQCQP